MRTDNASDSVKARFGTYVLIGICALLLVGLMPLALARFPVSDRVTERREAGPVVVLTVPSHASRSSPQRTDRLDDEDAATQTARLFDKLRRIDKLGRIDSRHKQSQISRSWVWRQDEFP